MIPRCRVRTLVARTRIALEPFTPDHLYRQPLCSGPQRSRLRRHLRCVHACCIPVYLPPGLQAACRLRRRDIPADPASWSSFACLTPKACSRQRRSMLRNDSSAPPHSHRISAFSSLRNPAHHHETQGPTGPYIPGVSHRRSALPLFRAWASKLPHSA